jgi:hypothetical protein
MHTDGCFSFFVATHKTTPLCDLSTAKKSSAELSRHFNNSVTNSVTRGMCLKKMGFIVSFD